MASSVGSAFRKRRLSEDPNAPPKAVLKRSEWQGRYVPMQTDAPDEAQEQKDISSAVQYFREFPGSAAAGLGRITLGTLHNEVPSKKINSGELLPDNEETLARSEPPGRRSICNA